jgi:hypothetical protein
MAPDPIIHRERIASRAETESRVPTVTRMTHHISPVRDVGLVYGESCAGKERMCVQSPRCRPET